MPPFQDRRFASSLLVLEVKMSICAIELFCREVNGKMPNDGKIERPRCCLRATIAHLKVLQTAHVDILSFTLKYNGKSALFSSMGQRT